MINVPTHVEAIAAMQAFLKKENLIDGIEAIGHRVVHGGKYISSAPVTQEVIDYIKSITLFAPLHEPAHAMGMEVAKEYFPTLPQVAVFDTAFHQTMPRKAFLYGIPYNYYEELQIRRYGFHGTSHRYVSAEAARCSGKSRKALILLRPIWVTVRPLQRFSVANVLIPPWDLLPWMVCHGHSLRSLDPAILFFLNKKLGFDIDRLDKLGIKKADCSDFQDSARYAHHYTGASEGHQGAQIALEVFCYKLVAKSVASLRLFTPGCAHLHGWHWRK
jgi:acetate kinase